MSARRRKKAAPDYFSHVRSEIKPLLPATARRILDVGCGSGATTAWLKTLYPGAYTIGLEGNPAVASILERNVDEAHIVDLNQPIPDIGAPDLILFLDILEHLVHPEQLLAQVVALMAEDATVIISLPNIAHLRVAARLFFLGRFDYQDAGILDRTHLRFYYKKSIFALVDSAGLRVRSVVRNGIERGGARRSSLLLHWLTLGLLRERLTEQYVVAAGKDSAARTCSTATATAFVGTLLSAGTTMMVERSL
jgi:SAM-dependent methyltransferase